MPYAPAKKSCGDCWAALPDVIARFERDLRFIYVSPAVERLTGRPEDLFSQLVPSVRKILIPASRKQLSSISFPPALGLRHLLALGFPETGEAGEISTVLTIVRDITQRKRAENELAFLLAREQGARETAELLNGVGPMLVGELDLRRLVQSVTGIASKLVGAEFGSFIDNVTGEKGEGVVRVDDITQGSASTERTNCSRDTCPSEVTWPRR